MGILDLPLGHIPQVVDPPLIQHARNVDDAILLEGAQVLRCDSREMLGSLALLDDNGECDVGVLLPVLEREREREREREISTSEAWTVRRDRGVELDFDGTQATETETHSIFCQQIPDPDGGL